MRAAAWRALNIRFLVARSLGALFWLVPAVAICAPAERAFAAVTKVRPPSRDGLSCATTFCTVDFAGGPDPNPSGTYQGHAPAADAARRVFTLKLASDGTAILTTLYIGKGTATQHGRWTQNGSQILLTFEAMGPGRPPPHAITFRHRGHELSPIRWDPSEWGRAGPPVLHRSRPETVSTGTLRDQPVALQPAQGGL